MLAGLPIFIVAAMYALRYALHRYLPQQHYLRLALICMIAFYGMIGISGSAKGYAHWRNIQQELPIVQVKILYTGECGALPYKLGDDGHLQKETSLYTPGNEPDPQTYFSPAEGRRGKGYCIGYALPLTALGGVAYASEFVDRRDFPLYATGDKVGVRVDPGDSGQNWLDTYVSATLRTSGYYLAFFLAVVMETLAASWRMIGRAAGPELDNEDGLTQAEPRKEGSLQP